LHGPNQRGVENRIESGIKKFAGRYARRDAWGHAINLYKRHLAYSPQSRSRMRRLADAYDQAGQSEQQEAMLRQALQLDLIQLKEDTTSASLHRSLYRSYQKLGDFTKAPTSDNAAYSAARTYDLLGRRADALAQYKRAFELNPRSSRNRRGYRDARGH